MTNWIVLLWKYLKQVWASYQFGRCIFRVLLETCSNCTVNTDRAFIGRSGVHIQSNTSQQSKLDTNNAIKCIIKLHFDYSTKECWIFPPVSHMHWAIEGIEKVFKKLRTPVQPEKCKSANVWTLSRSREKYNRSIQSCSTFAVWWSEYTYLGSSERQSEMYFKQWPS